MKYVFIHGAGDRYATDNRAIELKKRIPSLTGLDYWTHETYATTWASLKQQTSGDNYNTVYIGESFGGFWASQLALERKAYCYLLNPVIFPAWQMLQFVGSTLQSGGSILTTDTVRSFAGAPDVRVPLLKERVGVMLGRNDEVLDAYSGEQFWKAFGADITWTQDTHAISITGSFATIVRKVNAFAEESAFAYSLRKLQLVFDDLDALF